MEPFISHCPKHTGPLMLLTGIIKPCGHPLPPTVMLCDYRTEVPLPFVTHAQCFRQASVKCGVCKGQVLLSIEPYDGGARCPNPHRTSTI